MKTQIIKQEKNPFLGREEFTIEITNEKSPTYEEVKTELGKDKDLTVIKKINTNFGRKTFLVEAVVYDNAELKEKIETVPQKVRKKIEAEKKATEEAAKKAKEETKKAEEEPETIEAEAHVEEESKEEPRVEETKKEVKEEGKLK